jgi:hypothetical protein
MIGTSALVNGDAKMPGLYVTCPSFCNPAMLLKDSGVMLGGYW